MQSITLIHADSFAAQSRQALVLSLFQCLREGGAFLLQFSTDPSALCSQLDLLQQPDLHWAVVEKREGDWMIRISKRQSEESSGGCCGACGG